MISLAITFLAVALIAAVLGFGGIAGAAADFAVIIFYLALILFALSLAYNLMTGRRPPPAL